MREGGWPSSMRAGVLREAAFKLLILAGGKMKLSLTPGRPIPQMINLLVTSGMVGATGLRTVLLHRTASFLTPLRQQPAKLILRQRMTTVSHSLARHTCQPLCVSPHLPCLPASSLSEQGAAERRHDIVVDPFCLRQFAPEYGANRIEMNPR